MQDSHRYVGHLKSRETTNTARPKASHLHLIEIKSYSLKLSYLVVARNYVISREFICVIVGLMPHYGYHNQFIIALFVRGVFASLHGICEVGLK